MKSVNEIVSVVVPIYNVEKYLERCLESLKNQTYKNIEVLMIDDGSKDGSATIAKKYENIDSRFRFFHKENGGLSSARNMGMEYAKGKYISFVDSDDFLPDNYAKAMLDSFNDDTDVIIAEYADFDPLNNEYHNIPSNTSYDGVFNFETRSKLLKNLLHHNSYFMPVWKNMYRLDLIKSNNLKFDSERLVYMEDQVFNLKAYYFSRETRLLRKTVYFHQIIPGSLSQGYRANMLEMCKERYRVITEFLQENQLLDAKQEYENALPEMLIDTLVMLCRCPLSTAVANAKKVFTDELTAKAICIGNAYLKRRYEKIIFSFMKLRAYRICAVTIKCMLFMKKMSR